VSVALVTGAAGFVGRHLVSRLRSDGVRVRVLARDASRLAGVEMLNEAFTLESTEDDWAVALEGVDLVYHLAGIAHRRAKAEELAAVNEHSPARLYRAAGRAGVGAFVWLSTVKVLGEVSAEPLTEDSVVVPEDAYAASKAAGEARLLALTGASTRLAIVRPPLVYGPGVKANFLHLLALARLATRGIPLPLGNATALRSMVGVTNLCDFLTRVGAVGEGVLHVADADDLSVVDVLTRLVGVARLKLLDVPASWMRSLLAAVGRRGVYTRLFEPLRLGSRASREALAWQPPAPTGALLDETFEWYLRH